MALKSKESVKHIQIKSMKSYRIVHLLKRGIFVILVVSFIIYAYVLYQQFESSFFPLNYGDGLSHKEQSDSEIDKQIHQMSQEGEGIQKIVESFTPQKDSSTPTNGLNGLKKGEKEQNRLLEIYENSQERDGLIFNVDCNKIQKDQREIDVDKLLNNVEREQTLRKQEIIIRRQQMIKDYQNEQNKELRRVQKDQMFDAIELEFMRTVEREETRDQDDYFKEHGNIQSLNLNNLTIQRDMKKQFEKYVNKNSPDNFKGVSNVDLDQVKCFIEYYDDHEMDLDFQSIRLCELIEFEYALIKWKGKTSLFDLLISFASLLRYLKQNNQITQETSKPVSNSTSGVLEYVAALFLEDLFNAKISFPHLFDYEDTEFEEQFDFFNALPLKSVVKNLAEYWSLNWIEIGLQNPSHLSFKTQKERSSNFHSLTKNLTSNSNRIIQLASLNDRQNRNSSHLSNITDNCNTKESNYTHHKTDLPNELITPIKIKTHRAKIDHSSAQHNLNTPPIETTKNDPVPIKNKETAQRKPDQLEITSEDEDEIISMKEQIIRLWNSTNWKKNFDNLHKNNYYLAIKKPIKKN